MGKSTTQNDSILRLQNFDPGQPGPILLNIQALIDVWMTKVMAGDIDEEMFDDDDPVEAGVIELEILASHDVVDDVERRERM